MLPVACCLLHAACCMLHAACCAHQVIISTNIAETSVTIDDVVFVIDAGRVKETRYDAEKNMPQLVTCWEAQANARQRRGRAGRVRAGVQRRATWCDMMQHFVAWSPSAL